MQVLFQDESRIKLFSQMQKDLISLDSNADEKIINDFLSQIPPNYFTTKEDLMMICKLFATYARITAKSTKRNSILLFEKIMNSMKLYLQDESSFFWDIFGGIYYFKLWMYEEGLISIDFIIQFLINFQQPSITEYFLPEIIEARPEIYNDDIKYRIENIPTESQIKELKEKRRKFFTFLRENRDYNDPAYNEIETDPLRLAIKRDDIDSFQRIISSTNLSINSQISDSIIENYHRFTYKITLLQFALEFNSTKICHFLIMNDADVNDKMIWSASFGCDYEMVHYFEKKMTQKFSELALINSISCWNDELTEYELNNYDNYGYFQQEDGDIDDIERLIETIGESFYYFNFSFIESTLLPFLRKNKKFVNENINEIVMSTFSDSTCFFTIEFLKYSNIDINYYSDSSKFSMLGRAIFHRNAKAVEILLNEPNIELNKPSLNGFSPLQEAAGIFSDTKIFNMLINHPKTELQYQNENSVDVFDVAISRGNFYAIRLLSESSYNYYKKSFFINLISIAIDRKFFMLIKELVKYFKSRIGNIKCDEAFNILKDKCLQNANNSEQMLQISNEINGQQNE